MKGANNQPTKVRKYDLMERTHAFSKSVRKFVKTIPKSVANVEDIKQLVRSSGSVGANYMEADLAISKKDFLHRIKICRKEAKESWHWLDGLDPGISPEVERNRQALIQESLELTRIFGASIRTLQNSNF
ncbi:MAG: four helix bundle protein [Candidatus Peribacteraceae bacterium]|nr:four helix bundle protein [Candidatus Peribacteraceae bacterium]